MSLPLSNAARWIVTGTAARSGTAETTGIKDRIARILRPPRWRRNPASTVPAYEFSVVSDRAGFDALEPDWNTLFERAGQPAQVFQTFNWNWHWANHYLGRNDAASASPALAIVTARSDDGRLVLLWPLVRSRVAGLQYLSWMGAPVTQYGDVLVDVMSAPDDLLAKSWTFILQTLKPDLLYLRKVRCTSNAGRLLAQIGALSSNHAAAPYAALSKTPEAEAFERTLTAHFRKNRRRLWRRLQELGPACFVQRSGGKRARELATEAVKLKQQWLKDRGLLSNAITDQKFNDFIADVAEARERPAGCTVNALTSNGALCAIAIGIACKTRFTMHMIAYEKAFECYGAGNLLMARSLHDAIDAKFDTFDFLGPDDVHKRQWTAEFEAVSDWTVPVSLPGWTYTLLFLQCLRPAMKRAFMRLPLSIRRKAASAVLTFIKRR